MINFVLHTITVILILINAANADSNKDRSFINIKNPVPCIRRFNSTHQIGCADSDIDTYSGIVYAVRNNTELNLLKTMDFRSNKIVAVTIPEFFPAVVNHYLEKREESSISGIVLLVIDNWEYPHPQSFSDDKKSPNNQFGIYNQNNNSLNKIIWNNDNTNNLMFEKFNIPYYLITDKSDAVKIIDDCYEKFNRQVFEGQKDSSKLSLSSTGHLCGMELGLDMSGSVNSKVCIRRESIQHTIESNSLCDPLGGVSYFNFLSQKPSNDLPITLVSIRIDTFTMYEYYTPAANEPISSLIGLLTLADLLSRNRNDMTKKNLIFTLFDNEAFEYGGSSRFVNDLILNKLNVETSSPSGSKEFKLNKDKIDTIIELSQLGSIGKNLYIHKDPLSYSKSKSIASIIDNLSANLEKYSNNSIKPVSDKNQQLAPSSIHSFLRQDLEIAGLLIADHEKSYSNNFYHSVFDTPDKINATFPENITELEAVNYTTGFASKLHGLITSIGQTLYYQASEKELTDQVDKKLLNQLVYCFYKNATCDFFRSVLSEKDWKGWVSVLASSLPKNKISFYTSVNNNEQKTGIWISQMLLKFLTRNRKFDKLTPEECNKDSDAYKMIVSYKNLTIEGINYINNICVGTSLYAVSSVSPAFNEYMDGRLVNTDQFPAWTESSWNGKPVQMRLFMYANKAIQISTIVIGLLTLIIAFAVTSVANRLSDKWFKINQPEHIAEIIEQ